MTLLSFDLFQTVPALTPVTAGALVDEVSVWEAAPALAVLQAGLEMEKAEGEETDALLSAIDMFATCLGGRKFERAGEAKHLVAQRLRRISPALFSGSLLRAGRHRPFEFLNRGRARISLQAIGSEEQTHPHDPPTARKMRKYASALADCARARARLARAGKSQEILRKAALKDDTVIQKAFEKEKLAPTLAETAILLLQTSAEIHREARETRLEAQARLNVSEILKGLKRYLDSYREASRAGDLFFSERNYSGAGFALAQQAACLYSLNVDWFVIADLFKRSMEAFEELEDRKNAAEMCSKLAHVLWEGGDFRGAADHFAKAFEAYRFLPDHVRAAQEWRHWVSVLERGGFYEEALALWIQKGKEEERRGKNARKRVDLYAVMGRLSGKMGRPEREIVFYLSAADVYLRINERQSSAVFYGLAALACEKTGDWKRAKGLWRGGIELVYSKGDSGGEGALCYVMANMLKETEEYRQAVRMYRRAIRRLSAEEDGRLADCHEGLGKSLLALGFREEGVEELRKAEQLYVDQKDYDRALSVQMIRRSCEEGN